MRFITTCRTLLLTGSLLGLCIPVLALAAGPDQDADGVPDSLDLCPETPKLKKVDPNLRIAPIFGKQELSNAPVAVAVDEKGCALDSDRDGVADHLDFCPEDTAEEISAGVGDNGCPLQSDGDGTPDYRDRCPQTPKGVATDRFGCPKRVGTSQPEPMSQ